MISCPLGSRKNNVLFRRIVPYYVFFSIAYFIISH